MRILQIAPPWFTVPPSDYGGTEWVVACLADGLSDVGHQVTLVASGGSRTRATLRSVHERPPTVHLGDPWFEVPHVLAAYEDVAGYDIIHDHTGAFGPALATLLSDRPPVVNTLHGPWTLANERLYRMISDRVELVAISHDQASRRPRGVRVAGVVHNGVPMDRYPLREHKDDVLVFVGRACADKGPELAVEVAKRLGLPLVMAIKVNEPSEIDYFDNVIAPTLHGADVEVRLGVGHDEKVELMGRARAVLMPIRWDEPFGLVTAEAMACGTPVVSFRRGAAPEIVVDGVTGYLVDPGDLEAFTEATELAVGIAPEACRDRIASSFSAERMVADYVALYERILTSPSRPLEAAG